MGSLPDIVRLAQVIICMTDREVDTDTRAKVIKDAINNNVLTQEQAMDLLIYDQTLDHYRYD